MPASATRPIALVVQQHVEESAILRNIRSVLVRAPHVQLHRLKRLDDRLAAHLDGVAVAGEYGSNLCMAALETPGVGEVFAAAVRAIEDKDASRLDRLFAVAETVPEAQPGLMSAFGWVSSQHLQGTVSQLLASPVPFRRRVGIAACAMHRVDPGAVLEVALKDGDPALRACALRIAGELGRIDLLASVHNALTDEVAVCRFRAATSAVLLGDRGAALESLMRFSRGPGAHREPALQMLLKAIELPRAHELLRIFADDPTDIRILIRGAGIAGDPQYLPWLIKQMSGEKLARLAGESFTFITGVDIAWLDLERKPPENFASGPSDDPSDDNVAMDEDDSLPWPDTAKIETWWSTHEQRFQPGSRYFMGQPVTSEHCLKVLKEGCQRQRMAAAQYICLMRPGTMLFNFAAPAWRQQRWLTQIG